eukprot:ANDGO_03545.mRNA.1 hypothetical protein
MSARGTSATRSSARGPSPYSQGSSRPSSSAGNRSGSASRSSANRPQSSLATSLPPSNSVSRPQSSHASSGGATGRTKDRPKTASGSAAGSGNPPSYMMMSSSALNDAIYGDLHKLRLDSIAQLRRKEIRREEEARRRLQHVLDSYDNGENDPNAHPHQQQGSSAAGSGSASPASKSHVSGSTSSPSPVASPSPSSSPSKHGQPTSPSQGDEISAKSLLVNDIRHLCQLLHMPKADETIYCQYATPELRDVLYRHKECTLIVLRWVEQRERLLREWAMVRLDEALDMNGKDSDGDSRATSPTNSSSGRTRSPVRGGASSLLKTKRRSSGQTNVNPNSAMGKMLAQLQESTVFVCEAVQQWRTMLTRPYAFLYQGSNYLEKMCNEPYILQGFFDSELFVPRLSGISIDRVRTCRHYMSREGDMHEAVVKYNESLSRDGFYVPVLKEAAFLLEDALLLEQHHLDSRQTEATTAASSDAQPQPQQQPQQQQQSQGTAATGTTPMATKTSGQDPHPTASTSAQSQDGVEGAKSSSSSTTAVAGGPSSGSSSAAGPPKTADHDASKPPTSESEKQSAPPPAVAAAPVPVSSSSNAAPSDQGKSDPAPATQDQKPSPVAAAPVPVAAASGSSAQATHSPTSTAEQTQTTSSPAHSSDAPTSHESAPSSDSTPVPASSSSSSSSSSTTVVASTPVPAESSAAASSTGSVRAPSAKYSPDVAATKVQATYRGHQSRVRVNGIREERSRAATAKMQASCNDQAVAPVVSQPESVAGQSASQETVPEVRAVDSEPAPVPQHTPSYAQPTTSSSRKGKYEPDVAATKIQSSFRGHQDRKRVAEIRQSRIAVKPQAVIVQQPPSDHPHSSQDSVVPPALSFSPATPQPSPEPAKSRPNKFSEDAAATKIQSSYRGHHDRQRVADIKAARSSEKSTPLGAPSESVTTSSDSMPVDSSSSSASSASSAVLVTPPPPASKYDDEQAATKIQSSFRGHQDRKKVDELKKSNSQRPPEGHDSVTAGAASQPQPAGVQSAEVTAGSTPQQSPVDEHSAATKIQSSYRGHQDRKKVDELKKSSASQSTLKNETAVAASVSQADSEPSAAQAEPASNHLRPPVDEHIAATKIQSSYRGHQDRKRVEEIKKTPRAPAAGPLPAETSASSPVVEEHNETAAAPIPSKYADESVAATKIQSSYRGHQDRKRVEEIKKSPQKPSSDIAPVPAVAPVLETAAEASPSTPSKHGDDAAAATKIQSSYRGHQDRKRVEEMRRTTTSTKSALPQAEQTEDRPASIEQSVPVTGAESALTTSVEPPREPSRKYQDENVAATKIQSSYRGHQDRKKVEERRVSARSSKNGLESESSVPNGMAA